MNRLQRQIEGLLANYRQLESSLEARGVSVKDLVTPSIEKTTEWVYGRRPTLGGDSPTKTLDGRSSGACWFLGVGDEVLLCEDTYCLT